MAAFAALLGVDEAACTEVNAGEIITERRRGRRVCRTAGECWVLELAPGPGDAPADRADELLPQADLVALTGTSLIDHAFDDLIALCRPDAFVLLLAPSAPLTPVLFEVDVSAIGGTRVIDPQAVLRLVGQGATFRQIKRGGGVRC